MKALLMSKDKTIEELKETIEQLQNTKSQSVPSFNKKKSTTENGKPKDSLKGIGSLSNLNPKKKKRRRKKKKNCQKYHHCLVKIWYEH